MSDNTLVPMDLDSFLGVAKQPSPLENLPMSDKITIVDIQVDDSGSMGDMTQTLIQGVNACLDGLRGAKSADFYVHIHGFRDTYYNGLLRNLKVSFGDLATATGRRYSAYEYESPVVDTAIRNYRLMQETMELYSSNGIPCTGAYVIITDALSNCDNSSPDEFKALVEANPANIVLGIGIVGAGANELDYKNLFSSMGITKIMTPDSSGVQFRHSMNEVSRSVVSASIVPR